MAEERLGAGAHVDAFNQCTSEAVRGGVNAAAHASRSAYAKLTQSYDVDAEASATNPAS